MIIFPKSERKKGQNHHLTVFLNDKNRVVIHFLYKLTEIIMIALFCRVEKNPADRPEYVSPVNKLIYFVMPNTSNGIINAAIKITASF